jgi:serine/threonine protein phosphatase PrpC
MKQQAYGKTDTGLKRTHNEDNYVIVEDLGLYLVADGMGGHNAGEVASRTAINTIVKFIRRCSVDSQLTWPFGIDGNISEAENMILTAVRLANKELCQLAAREPNFSGMGTTVAGVFLDGEKVCVVNVGDSRIYRIRGNEILQLTVDHSWVSEQLQKKLITEEEARNHRWKNVITRALGNRNSVEIDVNTVEVAPGDWLLLCTDGLSGMVKDEEIKEIVCSVEGNLELACSTLIQKANEYGGLDNITLILIKFLPEE